MEFTKFEKTLIYEALIHERDVLYNISTKAINDLSNILGYEIKNPAEERLQRLEKIISLFEEKK